MLVPSKQSIEHRNRYDATSRHLLPARPRDGMLRIISHEPWRESRNFRQILPVWHEFLRFGHLGPKFGAGLRSRIVSDIVNTGANAVRPVSGGRRKSFAGRTKRRKRCRIQNPLSPKDVWVRVPPSALAESCVLARQFPRESLPNPDSFGVCVVLYPAPHSVRFGADRCRLYPF